MVNQVPVDTHSIARLGQKYYGETPHPIRPLPSATNDVYLLKFRQHPKKVVKVFKRSDEGVHRELYLYKFLAQKNIPVPQVEHFDTTRSTIAQPWLSMDALGQSLHQLYWDRLYRYFGQSVLKRLFAEAGSAFAYIHNIQPEQSLIASTGMHVGNFRADLERKLISSINQLSKKERLEHSDIPKIERLFSQAQDSDEISLCHFDFGPKQLLIKRQKIAGVIDWEAARFSNPVYDFAKCELKLKLHYNLAGEFRHGYTQVRSLPDNYEELKKPYQLVAVLIMLKSLSQNSEEYGKYQQLLRELLTQS